MTDKRHICRSCGCDFDDHNHPTIGGCGSCGECEEWS